jgi:hypothetical protein
MREVTQKQFDVILECFSGEDGGVAFASLRALIEAMDTRAVEGDADAAEVLEQVARFSRLVQVAKKVMR